MKAMLLVKAVPTHMEEFALPFSRKNLLSRLRGGANSGGGFLSIRLQTHVSATAAATALPVSRLVFQISRKCAGSAFYGDAQESLSCGAPLMLSTVLPDPH